MSDTPFSHLPEDTDADLLASLYVDGEATPTERARVEADPDIMARVEQMRAVAETLAAPITPPPAQIQQAHLSAALATFDELGATGSQERSASSAVTEDVAAPSAAAATGVRSLSEARERRNRQLPSWLGAAAVAVLIVGGLSVFALNNQDSTEETASVPVGADSASASRTNDDAADADDEAMEEDAMEQEAMEDDAMEESAAMLAESGEAESSEPAIEEEAMEEDAMAEDADLETGAEEAPATTTTLAAEEPELDEPRTPIALQLEDGESAVDAYLRLLPELGDPQDGRCALAQDVAGLAAPADLVGFVFVVTQDGFGELFVAETDDGLTAVIVDQACVLLHE